MDDLKELHTQLVQLTKLALAQREDDLRLYVARMVRKLRASDSETAAQLENLLKQRPAARPATPFRRGSHEPTAPSAVPIDEESRLSLLKTFSPDSPMSPPILSERVRRGLDQLIHERQQTESLAERGLDPSRSAMFVGPPGVGKTLTARWLAQQLGVPLLVLDLTAVMSSLLGRSGANLRAALDYAKSIPCVLLLDEIDAIAKRRSDDSDVGELKRLVTVILQEVDEWPTSGLLLAATNHPELIDPALWRRFDLVVEFDPPSPVDVEEAIQRFLGRDGQQLDKWITSLALLYRGVSYSDIERDLNRMRRGLAIGNSSAEDMMQIMTQDRAGQLAHAERIELAVNLATTATLSQHAISNATGVSRDTIRKRTARK